MFIGTAIFAYNGSTIKIQENNVNKNQAINNQKQPTITINLQH